MSFLHTLATSAKGMFPETVTMFLAELSMFYRSAIRAQLPWLG
jgi:hypothetical protein